VRALAILVPLLGGCADIPGIIAELAKDPNAVCVHVTSIWVSATLDRNFGCEQPK